MQRYWLFGVAVAAFFIHFAMAEMNPGVTPGGRAVRTIEDASTGDRWVLERDPDHPGGPGRMVKLSNGVVRSVQDKKSAPVIRSGEIVIVEEKTNLVTLRLQGSALTSANCGEQLMVRLKVGGWRVRAIAEAPGRAHLTGEAR